MPSISAAARKKFSRKDIDKLQEAVKSYGAKGSGMDEGHLKGRHLSYHKFFDEEHTAAILERMEASAGDLILFAADKKVVYDSRIPEKRYCRKTGAFR